MKNLMIAILAMGFVGVANASGDFRSEAHYQANAGETFLEGSFAHGMGSSEFKGGGEQDVNGSAFTVGVEHGLNDHYSLYANTGFETITTEVGSQEFDQDGLGALNLGTNITHETSMGHIISNLNLEFNYEDADGENVQDGSMNLNLMLGHRFDLGHANWGLKLDLGLLAGDTEFDNGAPAQENETGYGLTAFYETHIMEQTVGLAELSYSDDGDDTTTIGLDLTARYDVDEQMSVLGGLSYLILDNDNLDSGNIFGLTVGLRYAM